MPIRKFSPVVLLLSLLCASAIQIRAQPRVDVRSRYERVLAVVPFIGKGTFDDPKRPMYAPTPAELRLAGTTRKGILAYTHLTSDDGTRALVEFVAMDRSAFQQMLADRSIKAFVKGRDRREDFEAEFLLHKKGFNFALFGVRMP